MATRTRPIDLFVNSGSTYSIVDQHGKTYTPEEARAAWESHQVNDYNLAFYRLATQCDFDVQKLRNFFDSH
jgi:hypothetical protein